MRRYGPRSSQPRTSCSPPPKPHGPVRQRARVGTSPAMLAYVLISAKTINSDFELAELLTKVGGSYVLDDALQPAFFAAAKNLNSDYEHGRTFLTVVERGEVPRPVVLAVLESAKGISSDHELSELLLALLTKDRGG